MWQGYRSNDFLLRDKTVKWVGAKPKQYIRQLRDRTYRIIKMAKQMINKDKLRELNVQLSIKNQENLTIFLLLNICYMAKLKDIWMIYTETDKEISVWHMNDKTGQHRPCADIFVMDGWCGCSFGDMLVGQNVVRLSYTETDIIGCHFRSWRRWWNSI